VIDMKASWFVAVAIVALGSVPLRSRQVDASSSDNENAKTTYAPAPAGFGDESASRSWEMSHVTGDLDGKLDSKTAKVGDRVALKIADKTQTSDGTLLPRGSRLVGHITQVQAHDNDRAIAQIAIVFDHAELKNGQSIPVHTLIRTVRPSGSVTGMSALDSDDTMSADSMSGARMGNVRGSVMGGAGTGGAMTTGAGGMTRGTVDRTAGTVDGTSSGVGTGAGAGTVGGVGASEDSAVQLAGHGDAPINGGAHAAAQQRAVPHPTGIPGIMLAGSSTASGLLIDADRKDIEFASGTRFEMGIVADR
jgi:hypothetical protein